MNLSVTLDWKGILALGGCCFIIISAVKMDDKELENVAIHLIDAFPKNTIADHPAIAAF